MPSAPLADGSYSMTAQTTDLAGNIGPASSALNPVKIDTVKPVISPIVFDVNQTQMTLFVPFNEDVSASLGDGTLSIQNVDTSTTLPAANQKFAWLLATTTAVYTFQNFPGTILPDGNWNATMYSNNVSDLAGNKPLAGSMLDFFFFRADANFDRAVNGLDFNAIATNFGAPGKHYVEGDYNFDGNVGTSDFNVLSAKFNTLLPLPAPPDPDPSEPISVLPPPPEASIFADGEAIDGLADDVLV